MEEVLKIKSFTDLVAWQKAHEAVLGIYRITEHFPEKEKYALTSQMRRAAVSLTSNIAEGFSRRSAKEKAQFYYMALGSNTELQNQLMLARDLGYLGDAQVFNQMIDRLILINKLINGLVKSMRRI